MTTTKFDIEKAREDARNNYRAATGNEPTQAELNYMTACVEGTEGLYNTERYGCVAEYLADVDSYIDTQRELNGLSNEDFIQQYGFSNVPTDEEMAYRGMPYADEPV
ncbi:MAG: hypothetical protein R3279_06490 [Putridiphycobacter sp.]|nr:hypothetical protein [Putridiphycobacter sp.]